MKNTFKITIESEPSDDGEYTWDFSQDGCVNQYFRDKPERMIVDAVEEVRHHIQSYLDDALEDDI